MAPLTRVVSGGSFRARVSGGGVQRFRLLGCGNAGVTLILARSVGFIVIRDDLARCGSPIVGCFGIVGGFSGAACVEPHRGW